MLISNWVYSIKNLIDINNNNIYFSHHAIKHVWTEGQFRSDYGVYHYVIRWYAIISSGLMVGSYS